MATPPFPARSRLSRPSVSTPIRGGALPKSPSTPYDLYHSRTQSPLSPTSSPRSTSAFLPPTSSSHQHSLGAYRRNVGFGSPGVGRSPRYSQTGTATSTDTASPRPFNNAAGRPAAKFVRRKSFKQRAQELPGSVYDWIIFSPWLDFADPSIGYPAGIALHLLGLLALSIHPDGPLHLSLTRSSTSTAKGLFTDQNGLAFKRRQAQDDTWRWLATLLASALLLAAIANAYHVFTATRRYHLWMKSASDRVHSENASLVEIPHPQDMETQASIQERLSTALAHFGAVAGKAVIWLVEQGLQQLRQIPYLGAIVRFLFPPPLSRRLGHSSSSPLANQMHAIDMWTAPDVQLRILSLYSPLHGFFYILYLKHNHGFSQFVSVFALMVVASAQLVVLVQFYTNLIRDKNIIAGEVMHEYDEKFVKPRAMTVSRDASTMTDEAEASAAKRQSWVNRRRSSDDEQGSSHAQGVVAAPKSGSKRGRKPRVTAS